MTPTALPTATGPRAAGLAQELLRPRRGRLVAVTAVFAGGTAVTLAGPALLGAVVDEVIGAGSGGRVDVLAVAFLAVTLAGAALAWLGEVLAARVARTSWPSCAPGPSTTPSGFPWPPCSARERASCSPAWTATSGPSPRRCAGPCPR